MNTSNLSKAFHLSFIGNSSDDLIAAYLKLFSSSLGQQDDGHDDGIYKKWMPLPETDFAYILDVSKASTVKKLEDFLGNTIEFFNLGSLRYCEVVREQKRIRVIRVNSKTRSRDQLKDLVLIHCIGEGQMMVQQGKEDSRDAESVSISTACCSDSMQKARNKLKKNIRKREQKNNKLQKRQTIKQQEGVDSDDNDADYPIISKTEVQLPNELSGLLERLSRKKLKINSLKIEQGIANERIRVLDEKIANLEGLIVQKDDLLTIAAQENAQKDKQIQEMQLLLKVRSQEIDALKSEHRIHQKLQQEVVALCAGSEALRQQLQESQDNQMNYAKTKELFKKKLEAEVMNKEKYIRKCEKKQLKIKELKYRVQDLEQKVKAADNQRENDNKHFQQLQEYLVKELNGLKEAKEAVQNELEKYKQQQKLKMNQKIDKKNVEEQEKKKIISRKSQRIAERLSSCEGKGSGEGGLSEGNNQNDVRLKEQMKKKKNVIFVDESPIRKRNKSSNRDEKIKIGIMHRCFDSQIEESSCSKTQQTMDEGYHENNRQNNHFQMHCADQNRLVAFRNQINAIPASAQYLQNANTNADSPNISPSLSATFTPQKKTKILDFSCSGSRSSRSNSRIQLSASQIAKIQEQKAFNQRILEKNENSAVKLDKIKRCCDEFKELCQLARVATNSLEMRDNMLQQQQQQQPMFQGEQRSNYNNIFSPLKENQRHNVTQGRQQQFNLDGGSRKY